MLKTNKLLLLAFLLCLIFLPTTLGSAEEGSILKNFGHGPELEDVLDHEDESHVAGGHDDPVAPVLLGVVIILIAAKLGGELFEYFNQPAVLGELIFGVILGNLSLIGFGFFDWVGFEIHIDILSRFGVIMLLFIVGLESNIKDMLRVGWPSLRVAIVGVVAPFLLGFWVSKMFFPDASFNVHLFIGATLTATSVGITARVFKDLGKLSLAEAKIILGAAVIDDIMGLIVLAIVSGIITTGTLSFVSVAGITFKALSFLVGAIILGGIAAPYLGRYIAKMHVEGMKIVTSLIFCFFMAWAANKMGLATIVGAFAAGLILDDVQFKHCWRKDHEGHHIPDLRVEELVNPIAAFLVPVFFVLMGLQVKLSTFADMSVLGVAFTLTIAAIIGKQVCGLVVKKGYNRLLIGLGMIPRGEVGLIFAAIGKSLGVVDDALFSAIVIMVIITTLATPSALKMVLERK